MSHLAYLACWTSEETKEILQMFASTDDETVPFMPTTDAALPIRSPTPIKPKVKKARSSKLRIEDLFKKDGGIKVSGIAKRVSILGERLHLPPITIANATSSVVEMYKEGSKNNPIDLTM